MTQESGSLTAFLAVLAVGLFVLVGLVVDGGRAVAAKRRAMDVAEQAARVGADQLSVDQLRAGQFVVDPSAAEVAVNRYLGASGENGTVSVIGDTVSVHVAGSTPTSILGIVGVTEIPLAVTATATDLHGVTKGAR